MLQSSLDWGPKPAIEEQHLSWGERLLPWFWNISGHQVNVRLHSLWSISFNHDILVMPTLKRSMKSGWRLSPTWCLRTYLKMIGCVMHCIRRSEIPTWWCMTSSNMNHGWKEILGEHISILSTRLSATLPGSEKTSMSRPGKSMPEILLAEVGRLRLLLLLQSSSSWCKRQSESKGQRKGEGCSKAQSEIWRGSCTTITSTKATCQRKRARKKRKVKEPKCQSSWQEEDTMSLPFHQEVLQKRKGLWIQSRSKDIWC